MSTSQTIRRICLTLLLFTVVALAVLVPITTAQGNTAAIHGTKFDDVNGNGQHDANEPGIPNWPIDLVSVTGVPSQTLTDANGNYWFMNLPAGQYTVAEGQFPGWVQTFPPFPGNHQVTLADGQVVDGIDFGNMRLDPDLGSIHGIKFLDENINGKYDPGEQLLAGWTICIQGPDGVVQCTVTNANGEYWFMDLAPGDYKVYEALRFQHPPWTQTVPSGQGWYDIVVVAGQAATNVIFGNVPEVNSWCQTHWDVHIPPARFQLQTMFWMRISNHTPNTFQYEIDVEGLQGVNGITGFSTIPGMPVTVPGNSHVDVKVTLNPNPQVVGNSGQFQVLVTNITNGTTIACGGTMWSPTTHDTFFPNNVPPTIPEIPGGENGQVNLPIENKGADDLVIDFEIEGMMGMGEGIIGRAADGISLNGLPPGTAVSGTTTIQANSTVTIPVSAEAMGVSGLGDIIYSLKISDELVSVASIPVDFLPPISSTGAIHGLKFEDLNGDGIRDEGEPALPGWVIELTSSTNTTIAVTTDASGQYWFMNLKPGIYTVTEQLMPGWMQTFPLPPGHHVLNVAENQPIDGVLFGNKRVDTDLASIHGIKYEDQNLDGMYNVGEPLLPGWLICIQTSDGKVQCTTTDAQGRYWFMNLAPGPVKVYEGLRFWMGWSQTEPKAGSHTVVLTPGEVRDNVNFGNIPDDRHWCQTHWDVHIPPNLLDPRPPTKFWMRIINHTQDKHSYNLDVQGLEGIHGITTFMTSIGMPIMVPGGSFVDILISIEPHPQVDGDSGPFQVIVTEVVVDPNTDKPWSVACGGRFWDPKTHNTFFPGQAEPTVPTIPAGQSGEVGLPIQNLDPNNALALGLRVFGMFGMENENRSGAHGAIQTGISINGEPPGTAISGTIIIPPGGTETFTVTAKAEGEFGFGDVIFEMDVDGDGNPESVSSRAVDFELPFTYLPLILK